MKLGYQWLSAGLVLSLAVTAAGCSSDKLAGGEENKPAVTLKELSKDEKASVKVLYFSKDQFFQQYGALFAKKFPNLDVQVISVQSVFANGKDVKKKFKKLVDDERPDVLLFPMTDLFEQWISDGKLLQLDDIIRQDKFDVENMMPGVIEQIKSIGDGKLYGLSPYFHSGALYYNRDLFEKHGVPFPKNQMTWEDVLALAKRFPTKGEGEQRIYGITSNHSFLDPVTFGIDYMSKIGATKGLSMLDREQGKVTLQSDEWRSALALTAEALKSGAVYTGQDMKPLEPDKGISQEDMYKQDLFVAGRAAMTINRSYYLGTIMQVKDVFKNMTPINWDIVTVPVDPRDPEASDELTVGNVFAVHVDSPNQRAAWELVKYINSDEMAKASSSSYPGELSTRPAYIKERDGRSLEPFYKLKMIKNPFPKGAEEVPVSFYAAFNQMAEAEVRAVVEGKKSVDEALQTMQEKGQEIYNKAKLEQNNTEKKGQG